MTDIAVVTGTSSGMGLHAAVGLAQAGVQVVATMRDTTRAGALREAAQQAGCDIDVRALDVTDHAAAVSCLRGIRDDYGSLDILVNNAGRGSVGTAEQLSMDDVRDQLEVNYLGPVALTQAVLPAMRAAGRGRILTVTSVGGAVGQPFADAYCGAKFAVEGFMQSLAVVAERFGVWVSVIEPSAVASEFVSNVARAEGGPYDALLSAYLKRSAGAFASAQTPQSAGAAIVAAATSAQFQFRWQTSQTAATFVGLSLADVDGAKVLETTRSWIKTD